MVKRHSDHIKQSYYLLLLLVMSLSIGCNSTKHLTGNQYLVRKNSISIKSNKKISSKGEIKDNLTRYIIQKPNSYFLFPGTTVKLSLYNRHYCKFHNLPDSSLYIPDSTFKADSTLPKSLEPPVLYDTAKVSRTMQNMKTYLYYLGYFYATVKDTCIIKHRKAYVHYNIDMGLNYRVNNVQYDVDDSDIARLVRSEQGATALKKGKEFNYGMIDDERSRLTTLIRNHGYYKFTQENISFLNGLDTVDKSIFKDVESPFENAVNFISSTKAAKTHTINIKVTIRLADDSLAYHQYTISSVQVFPDYVNASGQVEDATIKKTIDSIDFNYHEEYVHPWVLYQHIYLNPNSLYAQADDDKTRSKLNELGIFQYLKVEFHENPSDKYKLDCNVLMSRAKKHDFTIHYEVSTGSTYSLGNSLGINYRIKNFAKGANLLTVGVNGGVELGYNTGPNFFKNFFALTKYYGVNASLDFPKFIAPIPLSWFGNNNLPHTIVSVGENVMDRFEYFTLINTSASLTYSWRQSTTKTWTLSPIFVNIIELPVETDSFKNALATNEYLYNSYTQNFIEGENISFTFDNSIKKRNENYSYLKVSFEEAGGILNGINSLTALDSIYKIQYAEYTKFDFDARHYFTLPKSVFAFRFYGGIGLPYGSSTALPYIKQYFAGGPYSLRGWRIRTLGPGSYYVPVINADQIDRTGDIKLELNGEYRFPISPLFAGAVKMNGAIFSDAGNIWLARKDKGYPGGEFEFSTLGQDIAMDMGAGLRFDIESFLTLRFDLAMPVKEPYASTNGGWVFSQINPYDSDWRANNLVLNVSIGYPF